MLMPLYAFSFLDRSTFDPLTDEWLPDDGAAKWEAILVADDLGQRNRVRPASDRYNGVLVVKEADREVIRMQISPSSTR
jgi:hypothetical protein